jgi:3-hydroxyisobutyrate dehydrogenase
MNKIAFIGLGNMGAPMAARLVERGVNVVGWDNSTAALDAFATSGGQVADSLEAALRGAAGVAIAVWSLSAVEEVTKVVFAMLPPKATTIIHSTIAPAEMLQLARAASEQGIECIDIMVSGGAPAARDGRLTFIAGGIQTAPAGWEAYFEALAGKTYFVGPAGAGCAAKLANNIMLFVNNTAILEAVKFARQFGVAEETVIEVASASTGRSWSTDMWDFQGDLVRDRLAKSNTLDVDFLVKDLELACKAAGESGFRLELSEACVDLMPAYYRDRFADESQI